MPITEEQSSAMVEVRDEQVELSYDRAEEILILFGFVSEFTGVDCHTFYHPECPEAGSFRMTDPDDYGTLGVYERVTLGQILRAVEIYHFSEDE